MRKAAWLLILFCSTVGHPQTPAQPQAATRLTLEAARTDATSLVLRWSGPPGLYELTYRHRSWPRDRFVTVTDLAGPTYTVVGLQHDTPYDFTLRLLGEPPPPPPGRKARPFEAKLRVRTAPLEPRRVGMLNLWPTVPLGTFDRDHSSPVIAAWKDMLYLVEVHDSDLYLSRLRPSDLSVDWTRELLAAQPEQTLTCLDLCVIADNFYILYLADSKPMLLVYNAQTQQIAAPPAPLPSAVSLTTYSDQVWALVYVTGADGCSRLGLTPQTMALEGTSPVFANTPPDAAHPSLSIFNNELLITYSDPAAIPGRPDYEPLFAVLFDGTRFHGARKLADLGRNFMARGQQLGPNLYLVYSSDVPYLSYAGKYAALMLATLYPRVPGVETIRYVDDSKYNFRADLTALGNTLYVVYEKLEAAPEPGQPTISHGNFIGKIEIGPLQR